MSSGTPCNLQKMYGNYNPKTYNGINAENRTSRANRLVMLAAGPTDRPKGQPTDPQKRARYDRGEDDLDGPSRGGRGVNPNDIFNMFFAQRGGGMRGGGMPHGFRRG